VSLSIPLPKGYGADWPRNKLTKNGCSAEFSKEGVEDPADPHARAPYISQADLPGY